MKPRFSRDDYHFALCAVGFTLVWGILGWLWSCQPAIHGFEGLGEWDAARIRAAFPGYVVDPASIAAGTDDLSWTWVDTEMKTRLALIAVSWLAGIIGFWLFHKHCHRFSKEPLAKQRVSTIPARGTN